jgi:hypothetical protein
MRAVDTAGTSEYVTDACLVLPSSAEVYASAANICWHRGCAFCLLWWEVESRLATSCVLAEMNATAL